MTDNNNTPEETTFSDNEMKMPASFSPVGEKKHSIFGPIIAVLIVLLILVLGGLYMMSESLFTTPTVAPTPIERPTAEENNEPESNNAEADVQALQTVSTSDTLDAIEADVESTDLEELDAELNAIDAELDALLQ